MNGRSNFKCQRNIQTRSEVGDVEINEELLEPFYEDNEIDVSKFICGLLDKGLQPLSDPRFKTIVNK